MTVPSSRIVSPGDTAVASAAHRAAVGTRASGLQRVDAGAGGAGVSARHDWRPAEDHDFAGGGSTGQQRRSPRRAELEFTPLVRRFAAAYVANEPPPGSESYSLASSRFADILRGVRAYEANSRIVSALKHDYARRGQNFNRLF